MSYLIGQTTLSHIGCLGLLGFNLIGAEPNPVWFKKFQKRHPDHDTPDH
jgi:hypothetical protein